MPLKFLASTNFSECGQQSLIQIFIVSEAATQVFLVKGVLKICSKFTEEHPSAWVFFCKFAAYFQNTFY